MAELPMVLIDVQRAGPSTGLPTKTEQADLHQAIWGRSGETPLCVLAAATPVDCFAMTLEAFRIAVEFMTPVILLSDAYLANGAEPWAIPDPASLPKFDVKHPTKPNSDDGRFLPYKRRANLAREWAIPGTPGLEHRVGGIEKRDVSGEVCYESENHDLMCRLRREKIENIAETIPPLKVIGDESGELLVLSWGSTYGPIISAVEQCRAQGRSVSSAHLRYLNPMPKNTGEVLIRYKRVLIPEMNLGQLAAHIRAAFLCETISLTRVLGRPFFIGEIRAKIEEFLDSCKGKP